MYLSQRYDFSSVQGDTYQWHALKHKTVVVNYFAEWCAPCLKEVPELNAFKQWVNTHPNIEIDKHNHLLHVQFATKKFT